VGFFSSIERIKMNLLIGIQENKVSTISSVDLVALVNEIRQSDWWEGEGFNKETTPPTELRHDHFITRIEKILGEAHPNFRGSYTGRDGREVKCYLLPKREAHLMVMSESYKVQARVYDRMAELESTAASPSFNIPTTLSGALRLAAEQAETIEAQALQIAVSKPAVEFVDKYVDSTGSKGFRQVCKLLKVKEPIFREFLTVKGIMYRLGGEWTPHAQHLDAGRFEVKAGTSDSNDHAFNSARFTPKGVTWIAGEFAKFQIEGV
jgi:phage antirepressor YoqD-like protein